MPSLLNRFMSIVWEAVHRFKGGLVVDHGAPLQFGEGDAPGAGQVFSDGDDIVIAFENNVAIRLRDYFLGSIVQVAALELGTWNGTAFTPTGGRIAPVLYVHNESGNANLYVASSSSSVFSYLLLTFNTNNNYAEIFSTHAMRVRAATNMSFGNFTAAQPYEFGSHVRLRSTSELRFGGTGASDHVGRIRASGGVLQIDEDLYWDEIGKAPILRSPNGTAYRLTVDNDGNLSTEAA